MGTAHLFAPDYRSQPAETGGQLSFSMVLTLIPHSITETLSAFLNFDL